MRRFTIGFGVVVLAAATFYLASPGDVLMLEYYELVDARTVRVGTYSGSAAWTRVADVTETSSQVQITVKSWRWPGPQRDIAYPTELTVTLDAPLGDRPVTDGFQIVPRRP